MSNGAAVCGPLSSFSRVRILHVVQSRSHRTIGELCEATGLHANTVREHLQRLIEGGYVIPSIERRTTRGRPRTLYTAATGAPDASSPVAREKVSAAARRGDLMRRLMRTGESALGREATYQLDALVEHLEESGFEPVVDEQELTIELSPCPHAAGRPVHRPVLCQVHIGLMQGVLAEAGARSLRRACEMPRAQRSARCSWVWCSCRSAGSTKDESRSRPYGESATSSAIGVASIWSWMGIGCSASVLDTQEKNLILTDAHCIANGIESATGRWSITEDTRRGMADGKRSFIPAYDPGARSDGASESVWAPYGVWKVVDAWVPRGLGGSGRSFGGAGHRSASSGGKG